MSQSILIHYGELSLKGKNRPYFEKKLLDNLKTALQSEKVSKFRKLYGRIVLDLEDDSDKESIVKRLGDVFGIANYALAWEIGRDIEEIKKKALEIAKDSEFITFRIEARRASKSFPMNSREINEEVGGYILENINDKKVQLVDPDLTIFAEVTDKNVYMYDHKSKGNGGLPVGVSGKLLSLISSGLDSPVASYKMMKRGAVVDFIHFHSYPQTSKESIKNVEKILKVLNKYQFGSKLYLVPFLDIQKEIISKANLDDAVVLYRRMMFRIAKSIADNDKSLALVTGESLGQVASQTIENINTIDNAIDIPVLRPLIGMDKEEVIEIARKIGTYKPSTQPYEDCCSLFVPPSPNTKTKIFNIERQEQKLDIQKMINTAIANIEIKIIK